MFASPAGATQTHMSTPTNTRRFAMIILLLAVACAHKQQDQASQKVIERATFDLKCSRDAVTVQKISDDHSFMGVKNTTWGASGCDRQITYKSSCGLGNCQVIADAASTAAN